jgi:trk system potassium uptake protein
LAERDSFSRLMAPRVDVARSGILVCGLGRFGSALATTLESLGYEVLGLDADERTVQMYAGLLTHVVQTDTTDVFALERLGARDFGCAVVAIGDDIEASILTAVALSDCGIESIWAKAATDAHGRILERVGATNVVFPERDMGERVAHLVTGRMLEYLEVDEGFSIVATTPPREMVGRTLAQSNVRARYGVTIVCTKPHGQTFGYATADTVVNEDDVLLIAAATDLAERFANLT